MSRTYRNRHNRGNLWFLKGRWDGDAWADDFRAKAHRDGILSDRGRHHYKEFCDWRRRNRERQFLIKINNYDIDNVTYPSEKQLKYLAWIVW